MSWNVTIYSRTKDFEKGDIDALIEKLPFWAQSRSAVAQYESGYSWCLYAQVDLYHKNPRELKIGGTAVMIDNAVEFCSLLQRLLTKAGYQTMMEPITGITP